MKDLFMLLLGVLKNSGNITAATFTEKSKYSNIEIETEKDVYTISICREDKPNEN